MRWWVSSAKDGVRAPSILACPSQSHIGLWIQASTTKLQPPPVQLNLEEKTTRAHQQTHSEVGK